jgi:endonuclease-3
MKSSEKKLIVKINNKLIERFGIPKRKKKLPDPVDLLVATILSQNTNDKNSYRAFESLKNKYPSWEEAERAKRTSIESEIKIAGLGKQKSESIKEFLSGLKKSKGKISLDYLKTYSDKEVVEELIMFKGIGVKTASCLLLFAMDKNVCPVDTHVHRTLNRIGLVKTNAPDKTFFLINENFPGSIAHSFHTNLIRLGREICKPAKPKCSLCPLLKICKFKNKNVTIENSLKKNDFMLLDNIS